MGTSVSLHPTIKPCPLWAMVTPMAKSSPMEHAAEIRAFRSDTTTSPICWRHRNNIVNKKHRGFGSVVSRLQNKQTKKILSYQFHATEIPWHQDGNNPSENALRVSKNKMTAWWLWLWHRYSVCYAAILARRLHADTRQRRLLIDRHLLFIK